MIFTNIDTTNLHHAYLIEGMRDDVVPEILVLVKSLGVEVVNNPDFSHISIDNFKMEEALSLRQMGTEKSFTTARKFFIVSANTFSLDAQQALLKMFEEPIENTHFFVVVPETDALIKTLLSRFYVIKTPKNSIDTKEAVRFLAMPLFKRVEFIKEFLADGEDNEETLVLDSARSKSLKFLNALELVLSQKIRDMEGDISFFDQIFKARQFLRQPGSSTKTLLESVALRLPLF